MTTPREIFHVILIRPTKYDAGGYPIQWYRTSIPANSLSCLYGIAHDAVDGSSAGIAMCHIAAANKAPPRRSHP